ncbi:stromal cell-derived factor 2-like protein 1 [Temnothorax americanus]|uniref:stromal cell-derived factor 2-like protein 1 n=1 Tax=Temnothorax americanus TaxID=1964332 RepID=UPI004068016A
MPLPTDMEAKLLRQIVLAGMADLKEDQDKAKWKHALEVRYNQGTGKIICRVSGTFGKAGWALPSMDIEHLWTVCSVAADDTWEHHQVIGQVDTTHSSNSTNAAVVSKYKLLEIWGLDEKSKGTNYVTCGSVLKLMNVDYNVRLHSHEVKYGSGSGQQSVTGTNVKEDGNSYWIVKAESGKQCIRGKPIRCGDTVRLKHIATKKNLHSHLVSLPLTGETLEQPSEHSNIAEM